MELRGERMIPADVATTWAALNDAETLKSCIAGCESLERNGDHGFVAVVAMRIGPVSARFKGQLRMTEVVAPTSCTLVFDGQGGVAGFGKGSAQVTLASVGDAATRLVYAAQATVGGKMAQIGARLIDATAAKISDDFFKAFAALLQSRAEAEAPAAEIAPVVAPSALADADRVEPAEPAKSVERVAAPRWVWGLATVVAVAVLAWLALR